jgi:hypothetical protein
MYAYTHGNKVKNHWENKVGIRVSVHDNLWFGGWHCLQPTGAQQGVVADESCRGGGGGSPIGTCPWNRLTDVNFYNNQCWHIGKNIGWFGNCSGDHEANTELIRLRVVDNVFLMNPGAVIGGTVGGVRQNDDPWPIPCYAITTMGMAADIEIRHNTCIMNNLSPNIQGSGLITGTMGTGPTYVYFLYTTAANGSYSDVNGDPRNNRWLIADNIIDGQGNGNNSARVFNSDGPLLTTAANYTAATMIPIFTDCIITHNLTTQDTRVYQQTVAADWFHPAAGTTTTPYSALGFANFSTNTMIPWPTTGWNITTGPNATAATDGTALGARQQ